MLDLKENAHLPSYEDGRGGFPQRGFSHLINVAKEWEEWSAERWVRLPTGTGSVPSMAWLLDCRDMGQQKGGDYWNNKEVLELGKSKWQQKIDNITCQSHNAKTKPDNFAVRWVLDNEASEKGMDVLTCMCTSPASVQLKKKMSQFSEPEIKVQIKDFKFKWQAY